MNEARLIIFRRQGYFELEIPYHSEFIAEFKRQFDSETRYWQPERKRWWVAIEELGRVKALAQEHFEYVSEVLA